MIFTTKYANQKLIKNSFLNYILYFISSPFVLISKKIGLSPNTLTTLSIISCAFSSFFLLSNYYETYVYFFIFSLLLDYSDGPLARMTNKVSRSKLNFDHLSDLFKIFLLSLCLCVFYNNKILFIVAFCFIFILLFLEILNNKLDSNNIKSQNSFIESNLNKLFNPNLKNLFLQVYNTLFIFHGHSLILFLFMPLSVDFAIFGLVYFSFLSFKSILIKIYKQNVK